MDVSVVEPMAKGKGPQIVLDLAEVRLVLPDSQSSSYLSIVAAVVWRYQRRNCGGALGYFRLFKCNESCEMAILPAGG